jgi:hypothetical protein
MRSEWEQPRLVEAWARAMGEHGDYWREALINPLVQSACLEIAGGGDPFRLSAFESTLRAVRGGTGAVVGGAGKDKDKGQPALAGLTVVDFGCGEACLGRMLAGQGARYLGLDCSDALLDIARRRAAAVRGGEQMSFAHADLEDDLAPVAAAARPLATPSLATSIIVLDHMEEVGPFLAWVGEWLAEQPAEVPLLCVTLAPDHQFEGAGRPTPDEEVVRDLRRPGEFVFKRRALVASCQQQVTVYLRSRRNYERAYRDAGLFIRRCEPLFFHRQHDRAAPDQRDDVSRRPVFWAWWLSARRRQRPAPSAVLWGEDTDAAALESSARGIAGSGAQRPAPSPPPPQVYDFRGGDVVIRVHNMGGELFAVLSGAAKMMDADQELMTFRAGEVLGDLETPDASGQCGSFPFDVVAAEEGCRVAVFSEATAAAVLANNREMGSRFFRLLRDRLRLALWHYDIREMVGEYLEVGNERLEKRLLHRCARALLWAAAIESRGRATSLPNDLAFVDPETIARRFKPGTERIDFGVVIRQLHLLRMIDAFPGAALRKEEDARAAASWDALVAAATRRHLFADGGVNGRAEAAIKAHVGRLRVSGQLTKDGNRTRQFQEVVDDLAPLGASVPDWRARIDRWTAYITRAHRFWEDRNPWLIVLRDVPGLRRIAVGNAQTMDDTLAARAEYFLGDGRRPTWELATAQTSPGRRQDYIAVFDELVAADLACGGRLAFSSDAAGAAAGGSGT